MLKILENYARTSINKKNPFDKKKMPFLTKKIYLRPGFFGWKYFCQNRTTGQER